MYHHHLPVETGVRVDRLAASDGHDGPFRYRLSAGDRTFEANQVIVATGAFQRPHIPEFASRLDPRSASFTRPTIAVRISSPTARCSSSA